MQSAILPFWPVVKDFFFNIWHLRLFLIVIISTLILSTSILVATEGNTLVPDGPLDAKICRAIRVTLNEVLPGSAEAYSPITAVGRCVRILNSLMGFILLGLLLWVIQESLGDHKLKRARYLFFPTHRDI